MPLLHAIASILFAVLLLGLYLWVALRVILAASRFLPALCRPIDRLPGTIQAVMNFHRLARPPSIAGNFGQRIEKLL